MYPVSVARFLPLLLLTNGHLISQLYHPLSKYVMSLETRGARIEERLRACVPATMMIPAGRVSGQRRNKRMADPTSRELYCQVQPIYVDSSQLLSSGRTPVATYPISLSAAAAALLIAGGLHSNPTPERSPQGKT